MCIRDRYTRGEDNKKVAQSALEAYNAATELANKDLKTTNPIRLGLALNFSVFYYEIMNEPSKASYKGLPLTFTLPGFLIYSPRSSPCLAMRLCR